MKTQIILIWLIINLLTVPSSFSQKKKLKESEVPATVVNSFNEKHKIKKSHCWKKDGNNYIVMYKADMGHRYKLQGVRGRKEINFRKWKKKETYSESGEFLRLEIVLKSKDLPQVVHDSFKQSEFKDWKICKIKSIAPSGQSKSYLIKLKKGKEKKEIYFDETGRLINN